MRNCVRDITTLICLATMLHFIHFITNRNMFPFYRVLKDGTIRQTFSYCVGISEITVNKLAGRGSLSSQGIVTNIQDFIAKIANGLEL